MVPVADCGWTGKQCGGKSSKWSEWNLPEIIKLSVKDKWKMKGWCNSWKLLFFLLPVFNPVAEVFAQCTWGFGRGKWNVGVVWGVRAPDQFRLPTILRLLSTGSDDLVFIHLISVRFQNTVSVNASVKRFVEALQLRQNNIHRRTCWHQNMFNISPL